MQVQDEGAGGEVGFFEAAVYEDAALVEFRAGGAVKEGGQVGRKKAQECVHAEVLLHSYAEWGRWGCWGHVLCDGL